MHINSHEIDMGKCKVNDKLFQCSDKNGSLSRSWAKRSLETMLFCMVYPSDFNVDHGFFKNWPTCWNKNSQEQLLNKTRPSSIEIGKNGFCLSWAWSQFEWGESDSFYTFIFSTTDKICTTWRDDTCIFKLHRKSNGDGIDVYRKISTMLLLTE